MTGPYGETAWQYRHAGWPGVLPLPVAAKSPPPNGFTGWAGVFPSGADIQSWVDGPERAGNVALRLPHGVYGLDVDAYGTKQGGAALRAAETNLGPLPATWIVTSRDDNTSGIRLFRASLDGGRRWKDEPAGHGVGIEAIHFGHRYAVVWPSVHPETGRKYIWYGPDGQVCAEVPRVDALPEMPPAWVEALSEPGEIATGEAASHADTLAAVETFPTGEACDRMTEAHTRGLERLRQARDGAALHPAARDATHELVRLGHEGHSGARRALAEHYGAFVAVRAGRPGADQRAAEAEWWRLARGAVGKLTGAPLSTCDCALMRGEGLLFDWAPASTAAPGDAETDANGGEGGVGGLVEAMRAELMTSAQIAQQPNPVALVRGMLYMNTLAWLIGKSGSFKSFVALDLAQHVAAGRAWADRRVRRGRVLYIVAEGAGGMTLRVRAWEKINGPASDEVLFLPRPIQANNPEWGVLIMMARQLDPALIVIDTQARVTVGIKENDNTEMGMFIQQIDRMRRATGACVLLVHHIGRAGEDARGASAIDGAQDTELKVERVGGAKSLTARLVTDKQKDAPDTESVDFGMVVVDLGEDPDTGDPLTSLAVSTAVFISAAERPWENDLPGKLGRILDVMHEQFSENGATGSQVLSVLRERGWSTDFPRTTFYRAWNELQRMDKIERISGTQRWLVAGIDHA